MNRGSGSWRNREAARASLALALVLALPAAPAWAQRSAILIPATTLDVAIGQLARQTGVDIASIDPGLRAIRTPAIRGSLTVDAALARLLRGSGYAARRLPGGGYRIEQASPRRVRPPTPQPRPAASIDPAAPVHGPDIVVTASKQRVSLLRYPGSLTLAAGVNGLPATPTGTLSDAAHQVPILQSTQLGAGRNKVFIRGIADSSFNGSTQSPTSVYLDDVQVNYSGPEPGLRLYDMASVEVLEGPQGTLYGSGAIGGVIRLTSNRVDLRHVATAATTGVTATQGAQPGFDLAGMVNIPLLPDRAGLRLVGYAIREGGYLRDDDRLRSDVNRSDTTGLRAALRIEPGAGWQVEASGAGQWIDTRDGQYAERAEGTLTRRTLAAQPFDNTLLFGRVVITKDWGSGLRFVSASGVTGYETHEVFDATPRNAKGRVIGPLTLYRANHDKELISQEARLSRSLSNGNSWVAGFTYVSDRDILARSYGQPGQDVSILGVTNVTTALSAFGESTFVLTPALSFTVGGRYTSARTDGDPSATPRANNFVRGRLTRRLDPTLAASWRIGREVALFARFQTGYRTGGLAVAPGIGRVADYKSDAITVVEAGIRKLRSGATGLTASGSISAARWEDVQADLITQRGQPYTANIGNAKILAVEGTLDWVPVAGLRAQGSFLLTENRVRGPVADLSRRNNRRLPETPPFAAHAALSYRWEQRPMQPLIGVSADYTGRSVLGTGDFLDVSQGRYWTADAYATLRIGKAELSLTLANLTDRRANQFAYGNPFTLSLRDQLTPLRPRNLRIGITTGW
ncbi:TonB-dependent receptor domain-containing protein [Sphingomonas sp. R1]|uniref:TonB-dependent receptor domain-containing protein n=1 Tax=Sphingomonas sp. R1 TaxID=399176 RepID=UPI0022252A2D|nr:TonB-dependent receptor [Sphingomonas sp. R1]UYY76067.1 TonB-dependent receptor [Sphingomonas sp. R1]